MNASCMRSTGLPLAPALVRWKKSKAMGLDTWITQQLHPATIDDTAMEKRLEQFPAMRLSEEDLTRKYPPGSVIRQVENGKMSAAHVQCAPSELFMRTR